MLFEAFRAISGKYPVSSSQRWQCIHHGSKAAAAATSGRPLQMHSLSPQPLRLTTCCSIIPGTSCHPCNFHAHVTLPRPASLHPHPSPQACNPCSSPPSRTHTAANTANTTSTWQHSLFPIHPYPHHLNSTSRRPRRTRTRWCAWAPPAAGCPASASSRSWWWTPSRCS